jgi:YD repeat-containing protein
MTAIMAAVTGSQQVPGDRLTPPPAAACAGGPAGSDDKRAGPVIRRRRLGAELRRLRQACSLRIEDAAVELGVAVSTLSRIETGHAQARTSYVRILLGLYGVTDPAVCGRLIDLAREGQRKGWWAACDHLLPAGAGSYLGLEAAAARSCAFACQTIPGLLRTPDDGHGTASGQPDTLTSAATTGPGAGSATYTYDRAGNTLTRDLPGGRQTLTWNPAGQLASDTTRAGTTRYLYDADGGLLLQEAAGQTTLYVSGEQLIWTHAGASSEVTGIRLISLPGGVIAVRAGGGSDFWLELTDQHGTSLLTLNHNARNPAWRQYTPCGAPRGKAPPAWPDTNGYLNDPVSPGPGLTLIGARAYINGPPMSLAPRCCESCPAMTSRGH